LRGERRLEWAESRRSQPMSEYDSDIEFDFFDELEPGESPEAPDRERQQRPPGGPPRRPSDHRQIPPTARLVGLIAFAILIIVLLVFWIQSCSGSSKKSSYENYFGKVSPLAVDSNRLGQQFSEALTTPGITAVQLANRLDTLAQQQQVDVEVANSLRAPSALRGPNEAIPESLSFRVTGLRGLADALRNTSGSTDVSTSAQGLAIQSQRLVSSDVVWEDLFRQGSIAVLQQQGVAGLAPPSSKFLKETGVDSQAFWTPVLERLNTASSSGGQPPAGTRIGTALVGTTALPKGTPLSTTELTTVTAGTDLGFVVSVQNSGDVQVVNIRVTITIAQPPKPITATQTIQRIDPGQTETATFKNLPQVDFVTQTTLKVDVEAVKGETNPNNNSASYPVIFSLG
jgi:CARDB